MSMFYDMRMKYANKQEKEKIRALETDIESRMKDLATKVGKDFSDYAASFGVTGPMAHSEATIFFHNGKMTGSDIDFAIVTRYVSPRRQRALEKEIKKTFSGSGIETGPLFFAPSIFKMPDLMFVEYAKSGRILYGTRPKCKAKIPTWEAAKLLTSRCGTLFASMRFEKHIKVSEKFPYAWSKSVLAAAEAFLILEGRYEFSAKKRLTKIRTSKHAKDIPRLLKMCQDAYACRYSGKPPKNKNLIQETAEILSCAFEETAEILAGKSGKAAGKLTAPFPSVISTRGFYFMSALKKGNISFPLSEPLVKEFEEMKKMFAMLKNGRIPTEKQRLHAVHLWRTAERFWLPY